MKYRTKFFISILVLTAFASMPGFAQYYPGGMGGMRQPGMSSMPQAGSSRPAIPNIAGEIASRETKWLKENLALDKDQAKAVKKLNNEYADQQQAAIKDIIGPSGQPGPQTREQIQDMMIMLNTEKEDKLKLLLTADQWKLYQSKKADMQREVGGFRPPAPKEMQAKPDSVKNQ